MAQLKRDYVALSHIPSLVTAFSPDGRVLHQNGVLQWHTSLRSEPVLVELVEGKS